MTATTRELDAWIHQHLFGWYEAKELEFPYRKGFLHNEHDFMCFEDMPEYSTKPEHAMTVLKKCMEDRSCVALENDKAGNATATLIDNQCQGMFIVNAYTLELAICLFAKKLFAKP